MSLSRRVTRQLCLVGTPLVLIAALLIGYSTAPVGASSHREAPLISKDPEADSTDFYMWITPDKNDSVTLVANYIPFELPEGGPNYYKFGDDVAYDINIDNVGDAKAHLTYRFTFKTTYVNTTTFLYNTGQITPAMVNNTDKTWSLRQTYNIDEIANIGTTGATTTTIASGLPTPPVNIGSKSTPGYDAIAAAAIKPVNFPNGGGAGTVFAGQRDDSFWVDLQVFDLLTLRGGPTPLPSPYMGNLGYTDGRIKHPVDSLAGYNVNSIVLQVPISHLTQGTETVIGGWQTASRRSTKVLNGLGGVLSGAGPVTESGPYVQVSRLGMPLVNEAVIPLQLKDAFNTLKPEQDTVALGLPGVGPLLASSVLTPELQTLFKALYNIPNPGKPRTDIFQIFFTGIQTSAEFTLTTAGGAVTVPAGTNVNKPATVTPAEMVRLNTAPAFRPGASGSLCAPTPSRLGLLGGDVCGFPNGRRLTDDVVEIELLAVAGAAYGVLTTDTSFAFDAKNLPAVLTDGKDQNDMPFLTSFPYLATPSSGQDRLHQPYNCNSLDLPCVFLTIVTKSQPASRAQMK